jgi:hypothetical protein
MGWEIKLVIRDARYSRYEKRLGNNEVDDREQYSANYTLGKCSLYIVGATGPTDERLSVFHCMHNYP